jgi:plastocyanin
MTKEPSMRGTANRVRLAAWLVAASVWPGVAIAAGPITGTVTFNGKPPTLRPLAMEADPACAKKHSAPVANDMLVLGAGNAMGNVMVWVSKGLPAGKAWPVPSAPVVMDQNGCQYKPHVMGIMVGQGYRILNSDGVLHNIHTYSEANAPINKAQPKFKKVMTETFTKPEMIRVTCDVHSWMNGWIVVLPHPYFGVTGPRGVTRIEAVPAGPHTLEVWHPELGRRTADVTVEPGKTAQVVVEYPA